MGPMQSQPRVDFSSPASKIRLGDSANVAADPAIVYLIRARFTTVGWIGVFPTIVTRD